MDKTESRYLLALEGGGTRSQAAVMDMDGRLLYLSEAGDVNTNFVSYAQAQQAVQSAARKALEGAGVQAGEVGTVVLALVGPRFGAETFGDLFPNGNYHYYHEQDVVFARAGIYQPHGVAVVAATGATAWAVRLDDGRTVFFGGWGSLLGDEGSAYAMGLLGLRAACRAYEGRTAVETGLVEALCHHLNIRQETFRQELVQLAYHKPLSRADIAGLAVVVTGLASQGDPLAGQIVKKVTSDLASLMLSACQRLFRPEEQFPVASAGGLLNAGEMILHPLRTRLHEQFPEAELLHGTEAPAVSLGRLAISNQG